MESNGHNALNLTNLPSDIIRHVIAVGLESIEFMRIISPRWNDLSLEHLSLRKRLPAIKEFYWCVNSEERSRLTIHVLDRFLSYFGLEGPEFRKISCGDEKVAQFDFGTVFNHVDHEEKLCRLLTRLFGRCSSIEKVELDMDTNESALSISMRALRSVIVKDLHLSGLCSFNKYTVSALRKFLRFREIQRIVIFADIAYLDNDIKETCDLSNDVKRFLEDKSIKVPPISAKNHVVVPEILLALDVTHSLTRHSTSIKLPSGLDLIDSHLGPIIFGSQSQNVNESTEDNEAAVCFGAIIDPGDHEAQAEIDDRLDRITRLMFNVDGYSDYEDDDDSLSLYDSFNDDHDHQLPFQLPDYFPP